MADPIPVQTSLPLAASEPTRCRKCGRDWTGIFNPEGADLGALLELPAGEFLAASACWMGRCVREMET